MSYVSCNRSFYTKDKGKGSPYSITERRVPELIPVLDSALWYHTTCSASTSKVRGGFMIRLLSQGSNLALEYEVRAKCHNN